MAEVERVDPVQAIRNKIFIVLDHPHGWGGSRAIEPMVLAFTQVLIHVRRSFDESAMVTGDYIRFLNDRGYHGTMALPDRGVSEVEAIRVLREFFAYMDERYDLSPETLSASTL